MKQFNRGRDFVLQLLFGVIAIAVLAWTSVRFPVIMGRDQLIGAFVLTVFPLIDAFAPLPAAAQETTIYKDSIRRFNELPEGEDDSTEAPVQPNGTSLSIEHLSFAYENQEKKVLNDLSLTIPENKN